MKIQLRDATVFLMLVSLGASAMASTFKKISIVSNDDARYLAQKTDLVFAKNDRAYLEELKAYIGKHGFKASAGSEFDFALSTLSWVSAQWQHDGMNEPAKDAHALQILKAVYEKHEQFRCVEYGLVLSEVLEAHGFVTRKISLRSKDSAYGGFGQGHVATEVWLNDLNKWIFLDGQFGLYLTRSGQVEPLNYFEIFEEKSAGRWESLQTHFLAAADHKAKDSDDYKAFLKNYFGHISVTSKKDAPAIALLLDSKATPATFQGGQVNDLIYTSDEKMLYPAMNRVSIALKYRADPPNFQTLAERLKIKSDDDFKKNMGAFGSEPKFKASFYQDVPDFDHFEYRLSGDGKWLRLDAKSLDWDALGALNVLEARGVNVFGRAGPVTKIEVRYE